MTNILFINNSRCSTCNKTMKILEDRGCKIQVVNYLDGELSEELLRKVLKALKLPAKDALRTKEDEFKALRIDLDNDEQVIKAIMKEPKLLQRPIMMKGDRAVIARPPENVLELF